jgi:hypothetical protein
VKPEKTRLTEPTVSYTAAKQIPKRMAWRAGRTPSQYRPRSTLPERTEGKMGCPLVCWPGTLLADIGAPQAEPTATCRLR